MERVKVLLTDLFGAERLGRIVVDDPGDRGNTYASYRIIDTGDFSTLQGGKIDQVRAEIILYINEGTAQNFEILDRDRNKTIKRILKDLSPQTVQMVEDYDAQKKRMFIRIFVTFKGTL